MEQKEFKPMVEDMWRHKMGGDPMDSIWQKLQHLKNVAKELNKEMPKMRASRNSITSVYSERGFRVTEPKEVEKEFVTFFKQLMGTATGIKPCPNTKIIKEGVCLSMQQQQELIQEVTYEEVDAVVKDMPNDKAPGTSKMKQVWNCTAITLIPKGPAPTTVKDYRPIACCTTVYKVIAKVITKRIKKVIESIIGKAQMVD
ncbi:PREDICTED: uncharacterized protein LOC109237728 [Nicotiana attenuata]|uniref:uncharacterized protein LOC109237728 n=1 Tax=Nicotiana attenuata TaxID=49451 RepID=UPI000904DFCB|nr:PREDICTED: uncharacterized protein LOC109237728 [Nicotiana attenuata]